MDDAKNGSRGRTNNIAASNPNTSNNGSLSSTQVDPTRSHPPQDISGRESAYDTNSCCSEKNPPRSPSYGPTSTPLPKPKEFSATFEPPVTKQTLSELDVNKIVHNPKLRHDINYDPDLHFRPNLDGEKGRRKKQRADEFWDTTRNQLQNYLIDRDGFEKAFDNREWCLPATLKAIRGILETLVPSRDRQQVEDTFDVELLMQQFRRGTADLGKLANWLSELLKQHCAPMRDEWVDQMVTLLSKSEKTGDVALLVNGMCSLLAVLEAMKLDVANHQIRCLRPLLIEDTVHFEQKFFMKKIGMGKIEIAGAHAWFKRANALPNFGSLDIPLNSQGNDTWDFIKALVNLTLPSKTAEMVPHTFMFDEERLIKLRSDMQDLINLEVCMYMFCSLEKESKTQDARSLAHEDTPSTTHANSPSTSSPCLRPTSPADERMLSSPTLPSAHHFVPKSKFHAVQERGHFMTQPSGQQVWVHTPETDASPSPRSSPSTNASTPATSPTTPFYLSQPLVDSNTQARSTFKDLLFSDSSPSKWTNLSNSLALQILRSTNTPLTRLPQFESHFACHLSNPRSPCYQDAEKIVLGQLFSVLQKLVETYTPLTSMQLFEAATAAKSPAAPKPNGAREEMGEVATRIAHIGILHWRVWAPLAYLVDPDAEEANLEMRGDAP